MSCALKVPGRHYVLQRVFYMLEGRDFVLSVTVTKDPLTCVMTDDNGVSVSPGPLITDMVERFKIYRQQESLRVEDFHLIAVRVSNTLTRSSLRY